ncbi:hypothetical protein JL721_4093 [Aureococcus anophagefferens]|nr:hypothetical protein JL721_4093 [Aureococcus anophagefferens]
MGWLPDGDDDDLSFETTPRGPPPGPLKPLPPRSTKRRAVVVDSDLTNFAGDFWGLAYLLSSKDCDVVYVMASGGDTRMKMRILSKFLAHCGREDVEVGAGPPGAEPGSTTRRAARDGSTPPRGGAATVVCLGSAETLRRLLDLDADALSRDGRDVRVCCRFGSLDGSRPARPEAARRVFAAVGDVVVLPVDACAAEDHTPTGQTSLAKLPPFLCGDSQISLALAQVQLALTHVCRADPCRDFLAGALAAFLGRRRTRTPSSCSCGGPTATMLRQQQGRMTLGSFTFQSSMQIGHREPYRADCGSRSGFASRRSRAASCSAAMRARTSSACDRGAGP